MRVRALLLAALIAGLVGAVTGPPPVVHGFTHDYDALASVRGDVHESGVTDDSPTQLSGLAEGSAPLAAVGRGASTTPDRPVVATEAAD